MESEVTNYACRHTRLLSGRRHNFYGISHHHKNYFAPKDMEKGNGDNPIESG